MPDDNFLQSLEQSFAPTPEQQAENNLRFAEGMGVEPSQYGKDIHSGQQLGLAPSSIKDLPKLKVETLDRKEQRKAALQDGSVSSYFAADPKNAAVSYRDVEKLARIATFSKRLNAYTAEPQQFSSTGGRIAASLAGIGTGALEGLGGLSKAYYGTRLWLNEIDREFQEATGTGISITNPLLSGVADVDAEAEYLQRNVDVAKDMVQAFNVAVTGNDFETADAILREVKNNAYRGPFDIGLDDLSAAAVSLAPTLAASATGVGLAGLATVAGTQSAGSTFAEKFKGDNLQESSGKAVLSGIITGALTRLMPGGTEKAAQWLGNMKDPKAWVQRSLAGSIGREAASEFTEEGADEFLQALLVDGTTVQEAVDRSLKAGVIGGILGGGLSVAPARFAAKQEQARRAMGYAEQLDLIHQEFMQTDTGKNSPEKSLEFFQSHTDVPRETFADAKELQAIANADQTVAESLESIGISPEQMATAVESSGTLSINLPHLLTSPAYEAIKPILREKPAASSQMEAEAFDRSEEAQTLTEEEQQLQEEMADFNAAANELRQQYAEAAAITDKDIINAQTTPLIQRARSMYERNRKGYEAKGITPADWLRRIRIQRGQDAVVVPAKEVFEQTEDYEPTEFINAQPENMRRELSEALESTSDAMTPQQKVQALETAANVIAGRDTQLTLEEAAADTDTALDNLTSIQKRMTVEMPGQTEPVTAPKAIRELRRRQKIARNLIKCLS